MRFIVVGFELLFNTFSRVLDPDGGSVQCKEETSLNSTTMQKLYHYTTMKLNARMPNIINIFTWLFHLKHKDITIVFSSFSNSFHFLLYVSKLSPLAKYCAIIFVEHYDFVRIICCRRESCSKGACSDPQPYSSFFRWIMKNHEKFETFIRLNTSNMLSENPSCK